MAKTAFTTSDALTKKLWDEQLFRDSVKNSYFSPFMGENANSIITVKNALTKSKGDRITIGLRMRLSGTGVVSGQTLEGNEEKLTSYSMNVSLEQYRHAVRDNGAMDRQRAVFSIDEESKMALQDWGSEKIDQLVFDALFTSPTKIFYATSSGITSTGTAATAKAALTAADSKLTPAMISAMKTWAATGGARSYIPIRPIMISGKKHYVLLVHDDVAYDLKRNEEFRQAVREAEVRGGENPLFTGATAILDGVVIHAHENCPIATDGGGASVAWAKGKFMGAQAGVWAWGKRQETVSEKFDYQNEHGYAWGIIAGTAKSQFNSLDYGSVELYTSRTNISGL